MADPTDWYQTSLTPPSVIEAQIRVGVIPETNHAQAMVTLYDPVTKVQIGQWSIPHDNADSYRHLLDWAASKAGQALDETLEPF